MDDYDVAPSVTNAGSDFSAWFMARAGTAIDAYVDRAIRQPQVLNDVGRQFGVDDNGRLYTLGAPGGQIVANVNKQGQAISPTVLLIGAVLLVVLLGSK